MIILTFGLILAALIDFDTQYLFDDLVLPLLWLGLLVNYFDLITPLHDALLGAVVGYMSLWLVFWAYKIVRGVEGMGYGDFKLFALFGAWLGWELLLPLLLLASISAIVVQLPLILAGKREQHTPFSFGQYLAISGWVHLMFGQVISQAFYGY